MPAGKVARLYKSKQLLNVLNNTHIPFNILPRSQQRCREVFCFFKKNCQEDTDSLRGMLRYAEK
jgi:hypothetical protein